MKTKAIIKLFRCLPLLLLLNLSPFQVHAQLKQPEITKDSQITTPQDQGFHHGFGGELILNNFSFGVGGYYSHVTSPLSEFIFQTGITGIRDASQQQFQDIFTGRRIIPNKYKRALGFPFLFGIKQRLFARQIQDNFRVYISGSVGPALAFVYPYVQDNNNNGFRDIYGDREKVNGFFSGWKNGTWKWGADGELKIGAEIGRSFKTRTTIEFGFFFYYFKQGLQLMEPSKPKDPATYYNPDTFGEGGTKHFFDAQQYFGTPEIKVTIGGMW